ncbi:MAG: competence/damage-inducible protein A [Burkholderiaceae bacterium]|nr:competence/damage-inducible protein A [Burkholderiaceae bacterium]
MKIAQKSARFGLIIVGDEILSGKREDKHLTKVIELFAKRGLQISWSHYIGDDRDALVELYRRTLASEDIVISCGGIGATPDDHTRQAAAAALGVEVVLHAQAAALISERCAEMAHKGHGSADMTTPENLQRLKMGEFPADAEIIPNPFNRIPGFSIRHHWFVPGFPVMAWPMIEWILETHYAPYFNSHARVERSLIVFEVAESLLTPLMERMELAHPGVRSFCLPSVGDGADGKPARRHVELGVRGPDIAMTECAFDELRSEVLALGAEVGA